MNKMNLWFNCPYCGEMNAINVNEIEKACYCEDCKKEIFLKIQIEAKKMLGVA